MIDKIKTALKTAIYEATEVLLKAATDATAHFMLQPYSVTCSKCGEDMVYTKTIDCENDMNLIISPCTCQEDDDEN